VLATSSALAATWYISPTGSDTNSGTASSPWRTVEKAQSTGSAGDTVICYGGTYYDSTVNSSDSTYNYVHTITKGMTFSAYPGQVPVFNFTNTPTNLRPVGFNVTATTPTTFNWIQATGTPVGSQKLAINFYITGSGVNCTFNNCTAHDSQAIGFYFENHSTGTCSNCDAYYNQGTGSGTNENNDSVGNIDGFGAHGNGVTLVNCRAWANSDDNYDCINSTSPNTFSHCWAWNAGVGGGDGNGFKVGGFGCSGGSVPNPVPVHTVEYCLSVQNPGDAGFYANHQPGQAANWIHNTAYNNTVGYNMLEGTGSESTNCSVGGTNEVMHFNLVYASTYTDIENAPETGAAVSSNSWTETGVTVSAADFVSTLASQMTNARAANGSLPVITFMHLSPTGATALTNLGCFIVPSAPAGLTAGATNQQVTLAWTAEPGADGYNVYRSLTNGGAYTNIALWVATTNYTDAGVTTGTTYYYVVTSVNPGDESPYSAQVSVTPSAGPLITTASASPNPAYPGQLVTISATVTANTNPIATVTVNASAIGGLTNQTLMSDGAGHYTNSVTVSAATMAGVQMLTVNATDDLGNFSAPYSLSLNVTAVTETWDGDAGDNNWSDAANWVGDVAPGTGDNLIFAGLTRLTPVMDSANNISGLTFDPTAGAFTIGTTNRILTLNTGVTNNSANLQTLNVPVLLGAAATFNAAAANLVLGQTVTNGGNLLTLTDGGYNILLAGAISGTGGLTESGVGSGTLSATNTFSGPTTVASGTLQLANPLALQNSTLNYNGGSVTFSGITAATLGGLSGAQSLSLTNGASAAVALSVGTNNASTTYSGGLSGAGASLTKVGTGTLILTGNNSYTGASQVNAGVLQLNAGGVINGGAANVAAVGGAELVINGGSLTASASGNVGTSSAGLLVASGSATFNGGLTTDQGSDNVNLIEVTGGSLTAASLALGRTELIDTTQPTAGSTTYGLYVNGGTVNITGNMNMGATSSSANSSVNARIDGGSLIVGGVLTIGLNNGGRWSVVDVNGGTLMVTNTATGISVGGPYAGDAELLVRAGTVTAGIIGMGYGTIADSNVLNQTGGTLYVGSGGIVQVSPNALPAITLNGGLMGATANWSSSLPMTLAGTTTFQAADGSGVAHNISLGGVLSGSGGLTKTGGGVLTLSGNNTYAGTTTISNGTLLVNNTAASATGTNTVTVASSATLGGTGVISGAVTVNSGGTLWPGNPLGTLTISNNLTLAAGSTNFFEISNSPLTNDTAIVSGALTCGGTLIVTNIGATGLAAGNSFKLFNAVSYSGGFAKVVLPPLPTGLGWNTNSLNTGGTLSVVVSVVATTTGLNPLSVVTYGTPVTFTATVSPAPNTGDSVTFKDGATTLGTGTTSGGGVAAFTTTNTQLSAGTHSITAVFGGDASFAASTSGVSNQVVNAKSLTPVVTLNSRVYNGTTSAATIATRSLTGVVGSDDVNLGTSGVVAAFGSKDAGSSTISITGLSLSGTTAADYALVSTSTTATGTITKANSLITVSSSANPSYNNDSVTFTATVGGVDTPTGTVQYLTNGVLFDSEPLAGGVATSAGTALLPPGTNTVTAAYSGDENYLASTNSMSQVVAGRLRFNTISVGTNGLVMSGSGGVPSGTYYVLETTNMAAPLNLWTPLLTNQFDGNGNFNFTNPLGTNTQSFYLLQLQ
jgi:autotransporter-associated beta strand protein